MKNSDVRLITAQAALVCCLMGVSSFGQIARIEPAQPKTMQKAIVIYDTKAQGAKLTANDDIYVSVESTYPYEDKRVAKMKREGEVFKAEFTINPEWARVGFTFRTALASDGKAEITSMIYGDDGKPVRGAYVGEMVEGGYDQGSDRKNSRELFDKEIALYPNNYAAYPPKWRVAGRNMKSEEWKVMVKGDLDLLLKKNDEDSLEWLFAMAAGYVMIKQPDKALPLLKKMVSSWPGSLLTENVMSGLWYQAIAGDLTAKGREDARMIQFDFIRRNPDKKFCRDNLWQFWAEEGGKLVNGDFPLESIEAVANNWAADELGNPLPILALATIYSARKQKLDLALSLLEKSIGLLLQNKPRVFRGHDTDEDDLIQAYETKASLLLQQGAIEKAYESVKTAQALEAGSGYKTMNFNLYDLEGRIWRAFGNMVQAERAYLIAWHTGSDEAEPALREIYQKKTGNLDGFREGLRKRVYAILGTTPAKPFSGASLDGNKLDLTALKGKVVVLNFWFIGCGPCRAEIPGLNQLVKEFKGKDVIFIAFASDEETELREFLKTRPFDYQIVAKGFDVSEDYQVTSWPTHVIIDREGNVASRLIGGSENRHKELRKLIERVLD